MTSFLVLISTFAIMLCLAVIAKGVDRIEKVLDKIDFNTRL